MVSEYPRTRGPFTAGTSTGQRGLPPGAAARAAKKNSGSGGVLFTLPRHRSNGVRRAGSYSFGDERFHG
jgi:hypothetical protein